MGGCINECGWKLVPSDKFVLGISAERCGEPAAVRIIRPFRKTDLYLCEHHTNEFISTWGLHNSIEILVNHESGAL